MHRVSSALVGISSIIDGRAVAHLGLLVVFIEVAPESRAWLVPVVRHLVFAHAFRRKRRPIKAHCELTPQLKHALSKGQPRRLVTDAGRPAIAAKSLPVTAREALLGFGDRRIRQTIGCEFSLFEELRRVLAECAHERRRQEVGLDVDLTACNRLSCAGRKARADGSSRCGEHLELAEH